jgi:hypothetical protein
MRTLILTLVMMIGPAIAATSAATRDRPPTRGGAIFRWLKDGTYRSTHVAEPAVHPSLGPHGGNVRTWYNPVLVEDLAAGRTTFRKGAAMVKELYFDGTTDVIGWAVMRKVRARSAGGRGWWFFETFDGRGTVARGRGAGVCTGCHAEGVDYLRSAFRP